MFADLNSDPYFIHTENISLFKHMIEEKCTIIRKIYYLHLKMMAATFVKHVGIEEGWKIKCHWKETANLVKWKQVFNMTVINRIYYKIIL